MPIPNISTAEVETLVGEAKVITANLVWFTDGSAFRLEAMVLVVATNQVLRLTGVHGSRNYSFCLLFNNYPIRRWCTRNAHKNPDGEMLSGPHKHRFDEIDGDHWAYKPTDITPTDTNEDLFQFLKECNIEITGTYQAIAL